LKFPNGTTKDRIKWTACHFPEAGLYNYEIMSKSKVSIAQVFKKIVWPHRYYILLGLILIVISRAASLVTPWASKYLIDDVIANGDIPMLRTLITYIVIAIIVQSITSFALTRLLSVEAWHLISKLRVQIQQKVLSLPINFFDNNKSGALVARIMSDVTGVRNLIGTGLVQMVGGVLTAIASFFLLLQISPRMTLYVLAPISIFGIISLKAFGRIRPIFRTRRVINSEVTGRLTETLNGIRVIKGFNAETQESNTFEEGVEQLFQNVKKSLTTTAMVSSASTLLLGFASAGIMAIGGYLIIENNLTIGEFLSFTLYLGFMISPIMQMSNIGSQFTEAFAGLDRTEELMNKPSEADNPNRTQKIGKIRGDIRFDKVSFAYEEGKDVLHGISFKAPAGSVTALVGTSGSGKSTIAGLVASFITPQGGTISIDDKDLSKIVLDDYRQNLGVVLQDDFLFEGTIRENILFPRPDATATELLHAVETAHVNEFTDRFEDGLETVIGERGIKLSGGQRQRIAIARAVLANPKILILDEATSNLDTESEAYIQASLSELMKGRTTFVIAHRLSTIRKADQILVIEQGKIAEQGTHDELIALGGRYYELFTYQARI
jgi:ABC-type multidrug transport system fused ATPase/permease subunit